MFDAALFLGFPVDMAYLKAIEAVDPNLKAYFLNCQNGDYLCEVNHEGIRYLGKFAGQISNISDLGLLQNHIYSILRRVAPHYPYETIPLVLFSLSKSSC